VIARHILPLLAISIAQAQQLPKFEDYPVKEIFTGTPAAPILATPQQRLYRTRIREGVAKGAGVWRDGQEQPGPNFAGHYFVIRWMCGSPCGMTAIVDARTGQIYNPPISEDDGGGQMPFLLPEVILPDVKTGAPWVADLEYRLNSRLMVVKAYDQTQQENYVHYFLWTNNRWTLLRRAPLAPSPNKPPNPDH
jgi:hypothetical protein